MAHIYICIKPTRIIQSRLDPSISTGLKFVMARPSQTNPWHAVRGFSFEVPSASQNRLCLAKYLMKY